MNNWRLLLLAVVVVVQPIGSFTETNLIDGRECSERSEDQLYGYRKTEEHRSLDGIREDRQTNEDRRLSSLDGNRYWRYKTRRGPMVTRSESSLGRSETSISPELYRFSRNKERYSKVTGLRVSRESLNNNQNELRNSMVPNERDSCELRNRDNLGTARTVRLSRDARNARSVERESRNTMSRLPIRTSRSIEAETKTIQQKREEIVRSDSRRDARSNDATRSDSRYQFDNRENRRLRFSNVRVSMETRAERKVDEGNNRDSRVVRVELRRQRDLELFNEVSAVRRNSERISAGRMRESKDESASIVRYKMDRRNNNRIDERRQERDESKRSIDIHRLRKSEERRLDKQLNLASRGQEITSNAERMDRRSISMDRQLTLGESHNSRLSRASDEDTREERAYRNHNERRQQREYRHLSRDRTNFSLREARDSNDRTQESNRIVTRRDARESSKEGRQTRDNSLSRERTNIPLREVQHTEHTEQSGRIIRESSDERRLQRATPDSSRLSRDRTIMRLRENREILDGMERTQESRRIASQSSTEINSHKVHSRSREYIRDNERPDLRRQVLERNTEKAFRMTRSSSAERRLDNSKPRASRSAEASKVRDDTKTNERDGHRQATDLDSTIEQRMATYQRPYTTKSSSNENIQHDRSVKNRDDVRRSGDRDMTAKRTVVRRVTRNVATPQRFVSRSSSRTDRIRFERQVRNDAVFIKNERREMQRDDDITLRILLDRQPSKRVLNERRQHIRDATKDSRDRIDMSRNRDELKMDGRVESRRKRDAFSRTSERVLTERRQETRDSRNVQDENERRVSRRQREATREPRGTSLRRQIRINTERLADRFRESTSRSETRNERATRNIERQESDRSLKTAAGRRESRSVKRANNAMERMERITSLLLTRDDAKLEETSFRNIEGTFRDTMGSVGKSNESVFSIWQMMFYTLQGVYFCGFLVQMLTENANKTKKRTCNWWSTPKNLIKVD